MKVFLAVEDNEERIESFRRWQRPQFPLLTARSASSAIQINQLGPGNIYTGSATITISMNRRSIAGSSVAT